MSALDTQITLPLIGQAFSRGWKWWTGELLAAVPLSLRRRFRPQRPEIFIHVGPTEAVVFQPTETGWEERGRFAVADGGQNVWEMERLLQTAIRPNVHVRLANTLVLRRELDLPRAAETRLRDVVGLDLDRQTPLTADNAVFDVLVRERDPEAGRIRVALVAAKRGTIDDILTFCGRFGIRPKSIAVLNAAGNASEYNLLPGASPSGGGRFWRRPRLLAGAAIALLLLLNLTLAFGRLDTRLEHLSLELTKTRKASQATEKLRGQLERSQAEGKLLQEAQAQAGPLEVLRELTHLLPDDVWLFGFELRNGKVQIAGLAPSASDLIERLDKSDVFSNPRFSAAVTRADKPGNERFEITLDLRGKAGK